MDTIVTDRKKYDELLADSYKLQRVEVAARALITLIGDLELQIGDFHQLEKLANNLEVTIK